MIFLLVCSELDSAGGIVNWGYCLDDCPAEVPVPSCRAPPPVPSFGLQGTEQTNFVSSWFSYANLAHQYVVAAIKTRLHSPEWTYDPANITDEITLVVDSNDDDLADLYSVMANGTNVTYTCPHGYIFDGTFNTTFVATCLNWTWEYDFNTTKYCTRKNILKKLYWPFYKYLHVF